MIIWMKKKYIMDSFFPTRTYWLCILLFSSQLFSSASCARSKNWAGTAALIPAKCCCLLVSKWAAGIFLLPLRAARGLFPHSGGWPAWCVSWVWPPVPCSNGQNLQNHHAQLDKVGRIIHLSLVWAPSERGRGLELIAASHQRLFIATFSLLAFAPWASNSESWFDARINFLVFQNM